MRRLTIILITVIFAGQTKAQTKLTLADTQMFHGLNDSCYYELTLDSNMLRGNYCYDYFTKSIIVVNKIYNHIVQTIQTPKNHIDCRMFKQLYTWTIFATEDVNFDGYSDIRVVQSLDYNKTDSLFYFYWLYNNKTKQFERDTTLEKVIKPSFDYKAKTILSINLLDYNDRKLKTYQYTNGMLTLIQEEELKIVDYKDANHFAELRSKWKLVDGKMKLVERKKSLPQTMYGN